MREATYCMYSNTNSTVECRAVRYRQRRLGKQLYRLYAEVTSEPVPASFIAILETADSNLLPQLQPAGSPRPLKKMSAPPLQKQRSKLNLCS
jgi:hypothetical protein